MTGVFNAHAVPETMELARVRMLPRRDWRIGYGVSNFDLIQTLTGAFMRPGGCQSLRPAQAACLSELYDCGGLCVPIGVGEGKTLPGFLAARAIGAKRPLLLIPAKMREKTEREKIAYQVNWVFPEPRIENYEQLSREASAGFLDIYEPDLIVCDEAQALKNPKAARTRRLMRYLRKQRAAGKTVALVIMSGTFTRRSVMDYWHLFRAALGDKHVPLPTNWNEAQTWAGAIDSKQNDLGRNPAGALVTLCDMSDVPALNAGGEQELAAIRGAFMRRLTQTPGVIATVESSVRCDLEINAHVIALPGLRDPFEKLRTKYMTPDDHPFSDAMSLWRHARELSCGMYYRWNPRPPEEWKQAKKAWAKFVRDVLSHSQKYDAELPVYNAVMRGELPLGNEILAAWSRLRPTFKPNQETVWCDDTVLRFAANWLANNDGICWTEHVAFGEELSRLTGRPYYGAGGLTHDKRSILDCSGPIIASIQANGTGHNLQAYHRNLIVSVPTSGAVWEQLAGRTHRPGQKSRAVYFDLVFACREQLAGFNYALADSAYIEHSTGQPQKLRRAANIELPDIDDLTGTHPAW